MQPRFDMVQALVGDRAAGEPGHDRRHVAETSLPSGLVSVGDVGTIAYRDEPGFEHGG